jgi:hypothetical protein
MLERRLSIITPCGSAGKVGKIATNNKLANEI